MDTRSSGRARIGPFPLWAVVVAAVVWAGATCAVALIFFAGLGGPGAVPAHNRERVRPPAAFRPPPGHGVWPLADAGSWVGYRVRERSRIPGLGGPARGRTAALEGFARIDGRSAVEVRVAADLRKLHSGRPGRDAFLGGRSLDTRDYPVATFVSSAPVDVPPGTSQERVRGRLTLHGAAGDVVLRARLQRAARRIEVLGEVTIRPSEFGIRPPDAGIFSVPDSGAIEFHLVFAARRRWRHERHHG